MVGKDLLTILPNWHAKLKLNLLRQRLLAARYINGVGKTILENKQMRRFSTRIRFFCDKSLLTML